MESLSKLLPQDEYILGMCRLVNDKLEHVFIGLRNVTSSLNSSTYHNAVADDRARASWLKERSDSAMRNRETAAFCLAVGKDIMVNVAGVMYLFAFEFMALAEKAGAFDLQSKWREERDEL